MGPVETEVVADIEELGELSDVEPSLAAIAYRLAQAIDGGEQCEECGQRSTDPKALPALAKELRATLAQLLGGHASGDDNIDLGPT